MSYFTQLLTAQAHSLRLPTGIKEHAERFVRQGSSGATPERLPFRRMLDFWAVAIGYAIATEQAIAPFRRRSPERSSSTLGPSTYRMRYATSLRSSHSQNSVPITRTSTALGRSSMSATCTQLRV